MKRGEVWVANLNPQRGREVGKIRPALVLQADWLTGQGAPTVLIAPMTTQRWESLDALRVEVPARDRLRKNCYVLAEKLRALDRDKFGEGPLATLTGTEMEAVERNLLAVLGIRVRS